MSDKGSAKQPAGAGVNVGNALAWAIIAILAVGAFAVSGGVKFRSAQTDEAWQTCRAAAQTTADMQACDARRPAAP